MGEIRTAHVKYIYLDVVGFTRERSVEAQSDIIGDLNAIVSESVSSAGVNASDVIYLPTGDGVCVALTSPDAGYDLHLRIALSILESVSTRNDATSDKTRAFEVRIGINENVDNVVTDINGSANVSGAGISTARRVMDLADGQQILAGPMVYETLRHRESYMKSFEGHMATVKHGVPLPVYQYTASGFPYLSTVVPQHFKSPSPRERRLSEAEAYYLAHALRNKQFFVAKRGLGQSDYASIVLLWFLAKDSEGLAHSTEYSPYSPHVFGGGEADMDDMFKYYMSVHFWLLAACTDRVMAELVDLREFFERDGFRTLWQFVTPAGQAKLKEEHPSIWAEFKLDEVA